MSALRELYNKDTEIGCVIDLSIECFANVAINSTQQREQYEALEDEIRSQDNEAWVEFGALSSGSGDFQEFAQKIKACVVGEPA